MLEDCIDAYDWCKENLPSLVGGMVDIDACAIGGDSSGGTLASLLGSMIQPPVRAIVDVYGPVDFTSPHFSKPPNPSPGPPKFEWSDGELEEALKDRDARNAIIAAPFEIELASIPEGEQRERWVVNEETFGYTKRVRLQTALKDYVGRRGPAVGVVLRLGDLKTDEEKMARRKEWSAVHRATHEYPPTAFLHGVDDKAVPIDQSLRFVKRLKELGVEVSENYEAGGVHAFDQDYMVSLTSFKVGS
jgi:acetyl esterase/lipase